MSDQKEYESWHREKAQVEVQDLSLYPWHQTALRLLPDLTNKNVLEIGCGRGDFAITVARANPLAHITAIDFSKVAINIAKEKSRNAGVEIYFEVGDAANLPFAESSFDQVISCECLEHVRRPARMAEEMARVLKDGGDFLLTTENYFNGMLLAWIQSWLTGKQFDSGSGVQAHENFFLYWRVRRLLERRGLRVIHMESNHFQWLLLPHVAPARLCTRKFERPVWNYLFRPFGRHFTYAGRKHGAARP
jgi:2-polyprenyl-3-methyl-5-hydroxy-6-metoxy-1,4-benzoquinol methylase